MKRVLLSLLLALCATSALADTASVGVAFAVTRRPVVVTPVDDLTYVLEPAAGLDVTATRSTTIRQSSAAFKIVSGRAACINVAGEPGEVVHIALPEPRTIPSILNGGTTLDFTSSPANAGYDVLLAACGTFLSETGEQADLDNVRQFDLTLDNNGNASAVIEFDAETVIFSLSDLKQTADLSRVIFDVDAEYAVQF